MDSYITVAAQSSAEITEKKSRFIATISPCNSEESALAFLSQIKTNYWDARHNVYAYHLRQGNIKRYSDDGEPHSTAGMPVLEVLTKSELTDCIIVVTRYFGGTLLGTGGLVRAYSEAAKQCIANAKIAEMKKCKEVFVTCEYSDYDKLCKLVNSLGTVIEQADFKTMVELKMVVPFTVLDDFCLKITDVFGGTLHPIIENEKYFGF